MTEHKQVARKVVSGGHSQAVKTMFALSIRVIAFTALSPLHFTLRKMKRNGFWYNDRFHFSKDSFKKQRYW